MSYDVWLEVDAGGSEPAVLDLLDANYTYNIGGMIERAGSARLPEWDRKPAEWVIGQCGLCLASLEGNRAAYDAMNPANGWGSRQGLVAFLREIEAACRMAPKAVFRVSF